MATVPAGSVGVYDANGFLQGVVPVGTPIPPGFQTVGAGQDVTPTIGGASYSQFAPPAAVNYAQPNSDTNPNPYQQSTYVPAQPPAGTAATAVPSLGPATTPSSAGTGGPLTGSTPSSSASNSGFSGLTTSGSNTGSTSVGGTTTTPGPVTNPPVTGTTGTPTVGSTQSGFSGLVGTGSGAAPTGSANPAVAPNAVAAPATVTPPAQGTTGTAGTGSATATGASVTPTQASFVQSYLQAHPDIANNFNNDPGYAQMYGSLANYVMADAQANGTPVEKSTLQTLQNAATAANAPQAATTGLTTPTATVPTVAGGNYQQQQAGAQGGQFLTAGQTNTAQNQTTGSAQTSAQNTAQTNAQNTAGTQTGTVGNVGQTTNASTGTQGTTTGQSTTAQGTQTTAPIDTLGFGQLLQGAAGNANSADATRNATLTNLAQSGDPYLQSQTQQAVANSLTGPQMTGAGDSARARAAGYAGAQVARNSAGTQLAATQQLAGPTALSTLSTAANPYVGTQTGTTGSTNATGFSNLVNNLLNTQNTNNTQTQNLANTSSTSGAQNTSTSGAQNTAGFSDLTGQQNESQGGSATGTSSQAAAGLIPQTQTVSSGGGGCVLCTAGIELGLWNNLRVLRRVIDYKLRHKKFQAAARGYFYLFTPLARWLLGHPRIAALLAPMARAVVYEELRVAGRRLPLRKWAFLVHWTGHALCHIIGKFPVAGRVTDPVIESIARRNNVWFSLS